MRIGFFLIFVPIFILIILAIINVNFSIPSFHWISTIGFGLIGLAFIKILKYFDFNRILFGLNIKKLFTICIFTIIFISFFIALVNVVLFALTWNFGIMSVDQWIEYLNMFTIIGGILTLIQYIAILIIGLTLFYLISDIFQNQHFERYYKFFNQRVLTIGLLIGIVGIIVQIIDIVFFSILIFSQPQWDGDIFWVHIGSNYTLFLYLVPSSLARLMIRISLILMFLSTINSIPKEILFLPMKKLVRTNIIQLFKISMLILIIFSALGFFTGIIYGWPSGFTGVRITTTPLHEQMVYQFYSVLQIITPIFIALAFGLISIVFYKIFHFLKFRPPPNQPNLNKGVSTFPNS